VRYSVYNIWDIYTVIAREDGTILYNYDGCVEPWNSCPDLSAYSAIFIRDITESELMLELL